jgi:pre-mRNA-splicing factor 38A|tara:strand:- start:1808 stop:2431 length:624 start_codon:yes stop_codon:yes gene_type:complete
VETITRAKIYDMPYWKEKCFGVSAETLVDLATDLRCFGGIHGGNNKATDFLCLTLKMLQIQPEREIVVEFIKNEDYKYVRALGAFYLRLTCAPLEIYQYLEPLLNDYRKLRYNSPQGKFSVRHVDEFVYDLLSKDYVCDIALPRIPHRQVLETAGQIEPRRSSLEDEPDADTHVQDAERDPDDDKKRRARETSGEPGESQPEKRLKA